LGGGRLTSQIAPIKITLVGPPLSGSDRHDKGKNSVNSHLDVDKEPFHEHS
jgi:hypothetical protein